jgi:hypothetical protein
MSRIDAARGLVLVLLAGASGACWDTHAPPLDAGPGGDGDTDAAGEPIPVCGPICEDHFEALCSSESMGLCTCMRRGNSDKGHWDCIQDWVSRTPACPADTAREGASCPRAITGIGQICAGSVAGQVCHCDAALAWRCHVAP